MKFLAGVCLCMSACVLLPAPAYGFLPFTIAATELAHWLVAFHLIVLAIVLRRRRRLATLVAISLVICALPLTQFRGLPPDITVVEPAVLPMNIRYYRAATATPRLAIVDIYGGAWRQGGPANDGLFNSYLAAQGYDVYAIDYRHTPAAQFPAQLDDVHAAIASIRTRTAASRLALCGRSSGAELALLAAYGRPEGVAGVISIYGPSNLTAGYDDVPFPDPMDERAILRNYLGGTPREVPDRYHDASPINYVRPGLPPTLLIHGGRDHIVKPRFSRELQRALVGAGNRAELLELPWSEHALDLVPGGMGRRRVLDAITAFLGGL